MKLHTITLCIAIFVTCSGSWLLFCRNRGIGGFFLSVGVIAAVVTVVKMIGGAQ